MKIIIAGAGAVGMHLAKWLSSESHDITLIDRNGERLSNIDTSVDAITITGEVSDFRLLQKANVGSADLFISVTSLEEANILSAVYAKKLGTRQCIARISQMQYLTDPDAIDLQELGIDELISPESLAAREVRYLIKSNAASESIEFENGKITLLGLDIEEDAYVTGKSMAEIAGDIAERNYVVVAIKREGETIIPRGHTVVEPGDHLFVITHTDGIEEVLEVTGQRKIRVKNIMIMGGSRTGKLLAKKLSRDYHVKLIEEDQARSEELATMCPNTLVLNFDGTDVEKLDEEGVSNTDVFVAVTGNSETNILSCLVAKNHGARKTIAMVENIEYLSLSQNIGIDSLINKKLAAANFIYRHIRRGDLVTLSTIHGVDAEVMEFSVEHDCRVTAKKVRELGLPKGALIGGVVRNNKALIPNGDFEIKLNDKVVVFASTQCAEKVGSFFK